MQSSSSASAASSSSSREEQLIPSSAPSTPSSDRILSGSSSMASVTPQNPFDMIISPGGGSTTSSADPIAPRSPAASLSSNPSGLSASAPSTPVTIAKGATTVPQSAPPMHSSSAFMIDSSALPPRPRTVEHRGVPHSVQHATPSPSGSAPPSHNSYIPQPVFDDDENTEPSSANLSLHQRHDPDNPAASDESTAAAGSFARFVEHTRRRLSSANAMLLRRDQPASRSGDDNNDDEDDVGLLDGALISGYLQKLGRNGKWQTRWFETDGECLSYYKSSKRTKLLATLDLAKVGQIETDDADSRGCSFSIQVLGRMYHLRAESRASCKDWVITLNRVKEARLNQGNTKLVHDLLQPDNADADVAVTTTTPRVVVVANRQRTRAVDESQEWDQLINNPNSSVAAAIEVEGEHTDDVVVDPYDPKRRSALGTVVLARWTKRRSSLSRLGAKLAKWARSLKKYRCSGIETESVHLDRHVHPPGHDDHTKKSPPPTLMNVPRPAPPSRDTRAFSVASEDDARFIA